MVAPRFVAVMGKKRSAAQRQAAKEARRSSEARRKDAADDADDEPQALTAPAPAAAAARQGSPPVRLPLLHSWPSPPHPTARMLLKWWRAGPVQPREHLLLQLGGPVPGCNPAAPQGLPAPPPTTPHTQLPRCDRHAVQRLADPAFAAAAAAAAAGAASPTGGKVKTKGKGKRAGGGGGGASVTNALMETMGQLNAPGSGGGTVNPRPLFQAVVRRCPRFDGYRQQDAHGTQYYRTVLGPD